MNKDKIIILIAAFALIGLFAKTYLFRSSDEDAILKTLESVAELMQTKEPLKPLNLALRIESLEKLIVKDIHASLSTPTKDHSVTGIQPLKTGALAASTQIQSSNVALVRVNIEIQGDISFAHFDTIVTGEDTNGDAFRGRYFVRVRLVEYENEAWRIQQIEVEDSAGPDGL